MNTKYIFVLGFLFSSFVIAAPVELPKTGQTICYAENGAVINCAGTGQDGDIQAGTAWPSPRFIDNGDGTITDNLTGLMWLQDGKFLWKNLNAPPWLSAFYLVQALNTNGADPGYPLTLPGAPYTDWRVPNAIELESLSNAGQANVKEWLEQPQQGFLNMYGFWTSTTFANDNEYDLGKAWEMGLNAVAGYDNLTWGRLKKGNHGTSPVIAVRNANATQGNATWRTGQALCYNDLNRLDIPKPTYADTIVDCAGTGQDGDTQTGVAWPSPRFTDEGDGTVTDNLTGLVWLKDANCMSTEYPEFDTERWVWLPGGNPDGDPEGDGRVTWQHALDFVNGINDGTFANCGAGQTDWHLPNRREMLSLLDFSTVSPVLALPAGNPFTNLVAPNYYWTSTTHSTYFPTRALALDLNVGAVGGFNKTGLNNDALWQLSAVWPVRTPVSTPTAEISVSPANHDFGPTLVNGFSGPVTVVISNVGTADLFVTSMFMLPSSPNFILANNAGLSPCGSSSPTIPASGNCTVTVTFNPDSVGIFNSTLTINSVGGVEATTEIALTGTGVTTPIADISITPVTHVFDDVVVNQSSPMLTVTLSNLGNQALNVSDIALTTATNYSFNQNAGSRPCGTNNPLIPAGDNCTVGVTFTPSMLANNLTDTLIITSDDPDEPSVNVQLSGNGVSDVPTPSLDEVPPLVASVTPARDASNVPANIGSITATFSEPVQGVNLVTFTVSSTGGAVAGTVQYDAAGMTAWFTPAADLDYMTTYTATLAAANISDLADNHLEQDYTWSFTTGGDPALAGCEPELQQEAGCQNFDYFTYGTGIDYNTYGSSVSGYATEEGARQSVSFEAPLTTHTENTGSSISAATARVDSMNFSLNSHSTRMSPSADLAGAWSMGASKIEVSGVPPGTVIPMSIVVAGDFDGPGGTLLLQVKDFDDYRGLGSLSTTGSGSPFTYNDPSTGTVYSFPANTYTRMVDPNGDKSDADNFVEDTSNGSNNLRLDFLYPAIPNNGIYVWFVAGVVNSDDVSNDDTDFTATLEVDPPPGVTVTLASGQVFTGDVDTDGDGVADVQDSAPGDASIASPASVDGTGSILIDASANIGVTLSQVRVLDSDDVSLPQAGRPVGRQFPDGLLSFRLNGLAPGATATVTLTFPTAFPADRKYYKVNDAGFYEYPAANVTFIGTHSVELRVTDGGDGDHDGIPIPNGVIIDPGGVAVPIPPPVVSVSRIAVSAATFSSGDGEKPVFGFIVNSDSADAEMHGLTIESTGTVSELGAFGTVSVYRDDNMDGVPEATELVAMGSYTSGDSQLIFTLAQPYSLPAGDTHFLITYQF